MKIALLEDDYLLKEHISRYFKLKSYEIDTFEDGEVILEANLANYDIFILDVNVPEINGFEVAKYFRDINLKTPIIFISSYTSIENIQKAFEIGANDYMKKPFELAELEIRIKHILKPLQGEIKLSNNNSYFLDKRILKKDNLEVNLTKVQSKILYTLIKNIGNLVTYETLREYVWENKDISFNTMATHMRDLKKKIGNNLIYNIKGEGYIFKKGNN